MNDLFSLLVVAIAGALLGGVFFGGLWWTVKKALTSDQAAWWFLGSMLLRTGVAVTGFYFIGQGDWRRLLACLLGFVIARFVVTRLTRTIAEGSDAS